MRLVEHVDVVEDEDRRSRHQVEHFPQPVNRRGDHRHPIDAGMSRTVGSTDLTWSRAAVSEVSRTAGSLSRSSSVSQANGRRSFAAHCARSVVFPYPVGAMTDTSGMPRDAWSWATRSVLGTSPLRRTDGRWSFVCASRSGPGEQGRVGETTVVVACAVEPWTGHGRRRLPRPSPYPSRSAPPIDRLRAGGVVRTGSPAPVLPAQHAIHRRGASPRRPQPYSTSMGWARSSDRSRVDLPGSSGKCCMRPHRPQTNAE